MEACLMKLQEGFKLDYVVIELKQINNFTGTFDFNPIMTAVCGLNVRAADIADTAPLALSLQTNWVLRCLQISGVDDYNYRNNGTTIPNVIKQFSRNALRNNFLWFPDYTIDFAKQNITRLDFALTNIDGAPIAVNPTTDSIRFELQFIRK